MLLRTKIQVPDDLLTSDLIKALESTVSKLKHEHKEGKDIYKVFSGVNPAANHLMLIVHESFDIMVEGLVKEICRVLDQK